jgi:hypothetical protein
MTTAYRQLSTVPAHIRYLAKQDTPRDEIPTGIKWSNLTFDVPAIGDIVNVRINRLRASRVVGYFTEHGFLGLLVKPLAPPEWFVKQNGRFSEAHVFGAEVDPLTDVEALRVTARVVRHRDPSDVSYGTRRKGDRYTVNVYSIGADGRDMLLLNGREMRKDPELVVKLAEKFCARNGLNLFSVEFPS